MQLDVFGICFVTTSSCYAAFFKFLLIHVYIYLNLTLFSGLVSVSVPSGAETQKSSSGCRDEGPEAPGHV